MTSWSNMLKIPKLPKLLPGKKSVKKIESKESTSSKEKEKKSNLLSYDKLPLWMQNNHYIQKHYLPPTNSSLICFKNMFKIHNQTLTCWSQLFAAIFFFHRFILLVLSNFDAVSDQVKTNWPNDTTYLEKFLIIICWPLSCSYFFLISTIYNSLTSHTIRYKKTWRYLVCGFIFMIGTCLVSWNYFYLDCWKILQARYLAVIVTIVFLLMFINFFSEKFSIKKKIFKKDFEFSLEESKSKLNSVLSIILVITAILPFIHIGYMKKQEIPTWGQNFRLAEMKNMVKMVFCYGIGLLLFHKRWPESKKPGKFDLFFHSNQLFYFGVVVGALYFEKGIKSMWSRNISLLEKSIDVCDFSDLSPKIELNIHNFVES